MRLRHALLVGLSLAIASPALASRTNEPIRGEVKNVQPAKPQASRDEAAKKDTQKKGKPEKKKKGKTAKKSKKPKKTKTAPTKKTGTAKITS